MTPQTIVETEKSFQTESQTNFENRRVRYSRHSHILTFILNTMFAFFTPDWRDILTFLTRCARRDVLEYLQTDSNYIVIGR